MELLCCMFAVAFAAFTMTLLNSLGMPVSSSTSMCPEVEFYSRCAAFQDVRTIMSFVIGALVCCLLSRKEDNDENEDGDEGECYNTRTFQFLANFW
mmetsp:Transcript_78310/g.217486  ORF Transcript_78310/g.217486 Transcript_78310/m.217486 type:complete len:96 (-) Transcript_78310:87-374(-)